MISGSRRNIVPIGVPFEGIEEFRRDANAQNYDFLEHLVSDWETGAEDFSGPAAEYVGVIENRQIMGIGGISVDQYLNNPKVGRLKHIYVLSQFRRQGVAFRIVEHLLANAASHYGSVRLRVASPESAILYERFGFEPIVDESASHILKLS